MAKKDVPVYEYDYCRRDLTPFPHIRYALCMSLIHVWIALRHIDLATATSPTNFPNINQRTPF
jgi:hypothetical protein